MTPRRRRLDRVGLLLLGLLVGLGGAAALILWRLNTARTAVVEERVQVRLGLPDEAFELEEVEEDGSLRILLRDVALLDRGGDTVVAAPAVRARLVGATLSADEGPIVIDQVVLEGPDIRLLQRPNGEWNFEDVMKAEAAGAPVEVPGDDDEPGRAIALRGVRVVDGRIRIATPYEAPANPNAPAGVEQPERVRTAGGVYTVRRLTNLQAVFPQIRVGAGGWRVEVARLSADVRNPNTRIQQLAGWVEADADETIRFDIDAFRTPRSAFDGEGRIRLAGAAPVFDLNLRAHPLSFADFQGMGLPLPPTGTAAFALNARSQSGGRTLWRVTDARVAILDSRLAGRLTVLTGGGQEPVFSDTRLVLDPLRLADLETLGYVERLPLLGTVSGEIASPDALQAGRGGPLRIDLAASLTPRTNPRAAPSVIAAAGLLRFTPGEDPLRLQGVRIEARPLRLEHLAALSDEPNALLRGTLTGSATVSGSTRDLRVQDGDLAYAVGDAPETVFRGLSGRFQLGETPRWEFRARAQPLALATLTELFPALPFRYATLSGPISASGVGDDVRFDLDLQGASGGIAARGSLTLGDPLRFDVSGRLDAFRASGVLAGDVPLEGPLSGTFSARGTTNDLRFAVDLRQGGGSFNLAGTLRKSGDQPYRFDVAGRVDNFRLGALVGRPGLLPGPVSGPIAVSGGGGDPYRFEVALTGPQGMFDVRGTFTPGTVPSYAVTGRIQGLDLSSLPGMASLPPTRLTGTIDLEGRGTTPETFTGRVAFDATPGSTVAGIRIEAGTVRLTAADGILNVQQLLLAVRGARLEASGSLGLTAPAPDVLRFEVDAPDLGVLAAFIPPPGRFEPEIAGSLQASGWVGGTLRYPEVAASARGSGLRWQTYQADQLAVQARLQRGATVWTGNVSVNGAGLAVGNQTIRAIALEANLAPEAASFGVDLRKDENTDIRASGILELQGLAVNGVLLRDLDVRLRDVHWTLGVPEARLARAEGGIVIQNLRMQRTGSEAAGFIEANGVLPTTGEANLVVRMAGIDMAELRQLVPTLPEVSGTLGMNASITGRVEDPSLVLDATVDSLGFGGLTTDRLTVQGHYGAGVMRLDADVLMAGRQLLDAEAAVPMTLTLGGLVPTFTMRRNEPLTATLRADSLPLQLVSGAMPAVLEEAEGAASALVTVSGTLDDPRVAGTAGVAGAMTIVPLGVRWRNLDVALRLEGQTITVERAVVHTGEDGIANVTGRVVLDQLDRPDLQLTVTSRNFQAIDNDEIASLQADADNLTITGRFPGAALRGRVTLEDGTIYIPELGEEAEADILDVEVGALGADTVSAGVVKPVGLGGLVPDDLEVVVGEQVWLESDDARIRIGGELTVYEAGGTLRAVGALEADRGTYTLRVGPVEREFEVVRGTVQFAGTPDLNPRLDIVARHEVRTRDPGTPDIGILVNVGGTLQQPTLALSSETRPPLPESELLTLLLFGRRSTDLANIPQEFTQGIILEQLVGGVLTNELEEAFASLGIFDYVRLRSRPTGTGFTGVPQFGADIFAYASIEAGKEVFEDAFLVFEVVDLLSDPKLGVSGEWEATRTWTVRGAWEPVRRDPLLLNLDRRGRQILLEARRRWEYGRPPEQPDPLADEPVPVTDEPRPAVQSTPTGEPPPPPPDDSP